MFDATVVKDHVPCHVFFNNDTKIVSLQHYTTSENEQNLEDKVLHIRILSCTNGTSKTMNNIKSMPLYGNKKPRLNNQSATYNRFFLVADLNNPPHCAAILTRSAPDSATLLQYTQGETFIGNAYYIREANLFDQIIGDVLPIISLGDPCLYPLKYTNSSFPDTKDKMEFPTRAGETNYFTLTQNKIKIGRVTYNTDTSCTGVQCDRQKSKSECSCLHGTKSSSYVYSFDVTFQVPKNIDERGVKTVFHFKSLQTTKLFFENFEQHAESTTTDQQKRNTQDYRKKFNAMVNYINESEGWTIVGWFKLGETIDAADNSNEKVVNYDITIHISYLMPTNKHEVMDSARYKSLLIKNPTIPSSNNTASAPITIE